MKKWFKILSFLLVTLFIIFFFLLCLSVITIFLRTPNISSSSPFTSYRYIEVDPSNNSTKFGIVKLRRRWINGYVTYKDDRTGRIIYFIGNEGRPLGSFRPKKNQENEDKKKKKKKEEEEEYEDWEYWKRRSEKPREFRCIGGCYCISRMGIDAQLLPARFVFVWGHTEEEAWYAAIDNLREMCSVTYAEYGNSCEVENVRGTIEDCSDWIDMQETIAWYEEMARRYEDYGHEQSRIKLERERDERERKKKEEERKKKLEEEKAEKASFFCVGHCLEIKESFVGKGINEGDCHSLEIAGEVKTNEGVIPKKVFVKEKLESFCEHAPCLADKKEWSSSNVLCVPS